MGTPNNQQSDTATDILRDVLTSGETNFRMKDLRATGIDIDMLEAMFDRSIKPYLDYLSGYTPLNEMFDAALDVFDWRKLVHTSIGHPDNTQCVGVISGVYLRTSDAGITLDLFLGRNGFWFAFLRKRDMRTRDYEFHLTDHGSCRSLCEYLLKEVGEPYGVSSLPLLIARHLHKVLDTTITQRAQRLRAMQLAELEMQKRLALVLR